VPVTARMGVLLVRRRRSLNQTQCDTRKQTADIRTYTQTTRPTADLLQLNNTLLHRPVRRLSCA